MEQVKTVRSPPLEEEAAAETTCGDLGVAPVLCASCAIVWDNEKTFIRMACYWKCCFLHSSLVV